MVWAARRPGAEAMSDIVERLRNPDGHGSKTEMEAAEEIERLREPHVYVSSDRVKKLAFLFRREIANQLRKKDADLRLWPAILSSALRGDDHNKNTQHSVDTLIMHFHPDKQQRREAAQRILDDLEFKFDSEIKKAEFAENSDVAKMMRRQISETRALMEKQVGSKLAHRETIDAANPAKILPPDPQETQH
jgi:hypothetical protein